MSEKPSSCKWCKTSEHIELSVGPGRVVGAIADSILGTCAPLPDTFAFWWCTKCNHRHLTPTLETKFREIEKTYLNKLMRAGS